MKSKAEESNLKKTLPIDRSMLLCSEDCYFMEPGVFTVSGRDGEQ